jgi:DNA invertase Pin-like site-specific DNA recombinase/Arc/MetJ-type ribon-helix-helix transcriptional regulator
MPAPSLSGKRIAIYARFSSSNQREASVEDQVRVCSDFIARDGGTVSDDLVFFDKGVSGSSLDRPGFERMMELVAAKPSRIDAIVCEDLSRVTRDLADGATLFKRLQYIGVPLIGVSDGINTANPHSKMSFGMKALMGEAYIDDLRFRTKRGLDGRALNDFSTGGLPIGYRSEPVTDAGNRVIGHGILIDDVGKATVVRIFSMYREGTSIEAIARTLNGEKVPSPRAKTRHRRKGWVASTVREILRNRAYVGEFTFNRRQWVKVPNSNTRRYRARPEHEIIRRSRPHLRIIDQELWNDVQTRVAAVRAHYTKTADGKPKGMALTGKRTTYPTSGLLHCAECGAPMTIYGGSSQRYYRCGDYKKRGTCSNGLSLREDVARHRILGLLRENLTTPKEVAFMREAAAEMLGEMSKKTNSELEEHRARLARTEQRVAGLVRFISDGDQSEAVRAALVDLEAHEKVEKAAIKALLERGKAAVRLPSPEQTVERATLFEKMLLEDPTRGREELRKMFEDGKVLLKPQPEGFYVAEGKFFPLTLFSLRLAPETPKARDSGESTGLPALMDREPGFSCSILSCAGSQLDFPTQQIQGVAEFWVPVEYAVSVGWT